MLLDRLQKRCDERLAAHQYRQPVCLSHTTRLSTDRVDSGSVCYLFSSNNYLGLANHPDLVSAFSEAAKHYGVGSGASPLVTGYSEVHRDTEKAYANFIGAESAMLCSSGFAANLSVIQGLAGRSDVVIHDHDNHASLLDATLVSRASLKRYDHLDMDSCDELLVQQQEKACLVASDAVFSMSGDVAPVRALSDLAKKHDASLLIDDSHGFGVSGKTGRGTLEVSGISMSDIDVLTVGLGKAMGCAGGLVLGSKALIDGLRQFSRAYVYSTAIPPALAAAAKKSLHILLEESWRVTELHRLINSFQEKAKRIGLQCLPSQSPIQSWVIGSEEKAVAMAEGLQEQGYLLMPIRTPTVPLGQARLRITLNVGQTDKDIEGLMQAIEKVRDRV